MPQVSDAGGVLFTWGRKSKCASRERSVASCSMVIAAIKMSLVGIGVARLCKCVRSALQISALRRVTGAMTT
jgi:hypothetical protein